MLGVRFRTAAPAVDETPPAGRRPSRPRARRLARAKALAVAARRPEAIVIGGDQTLAANGHIYGKPGSRAAAPAHARASSAASAGPSTARCASRNAGELREACVPTRVVWRQLTPRQIRNYVAREPSFASAGGAQLEKLGIALLESMRSEDPLGGHRPSLDRAGLDPRLIRPRNPRLAARARARAAGAARSRRSCGRRPLRRPARRPRSTRPPPGSRAARRRSGRAAGSARRPRPRAARARRARGRGPPC